MKLSTPFLYATTVVCITLAGCSPAAQDPAEEENSAQASNSPMVEVAGETLQGELLDSGTALAVFRGIPFAAPPVGDFRWKPPQPPAPREGIQQATEFGGVCPQGQGNVDFYKDIARRFGKSPDVIPPVGNIQEDCLYLNVWTTALNTAAKQPVMVWIYGGGNSEGYANDPDYFGHSLAQRGVVYVSFNYRLGHLGFMAHAGLSAESLRGVSGNYGILDQVAALQWVRDNISAFGGDPENVTILGESAGGANVATLIASPLGKGLFHRGIVQSGGYEMQSFHTLAEAEAYGAKIATAMGQGADANDAEIVSNLRELEWQKFIDDPAMPAFSSMRAVNVDGYVLPKTKAEMFASGSTNKAAIIIGSNANETFKNQSGDETPATFAETLANFGEPYATELQALLADDIVASLPMAIDRFATAASYLCGSRYIAKQMAAAGNDVYFYQFTRIRPGGERLLAYHGAEIPYALDTTADWLPADDKDRALTRSMSQYWINFATKGDPNGLGLPRWPRYEGQEGKYQVLGDVIRPGADVEPELCAILDRHRSARLAASR